VGENRARHHDKSHGGAGISLPELLSAHF